MSFSQFSKLIKALMFAAADPAHSFGERHTYGVPVHAKHVGLEFVMFVATWWSRGFNGILWSVHIPLTCTASDHARPTILIPLHLLNGGFAPKRAPAAHAMQRFDGMTPRATT